MIEVELSRFEMVLAGLAGVMRQAENALAGRGDAHGFNGDGSTSHVEGAQSELALAKLFDHYWTPVVKDFRTLSGDLGAGVQIRSTRRLDGCLIIRPPDRDEDRFYLVVGQAPRLNVVGSILGREAKDARYRRNPGGRPPAYFVPQSALRPIETELGGEW